MPKVTGKTYIEPSIVLAAIKAAGLEVDEQAAFFKVNGEGQRKLYIAKTKNVGRIDLSGPASMASVGIVPRKVSFSSPPTTTPRNSSSTLCLQRRTHAHLGKSQEDRP